MLISRRDFIRQFVILAMASLLSLFGFRKRFDLDDFKFEVAQKKAAKLRVLTQPLYDTEVIAAGHSIELRGFSYFISEPRS